MHVLYYGTAFLPKCYEEENFANEMTKTQVGHSYIVTRILWPTAVTRHITNINDTLTIAG